MQANAHIHGSPRLELIRTGFADRPAYGTAVSEAILLGVAAGELAPTLRLHRPARELAFSKQDRAAPGFAAAVRAARELGFEPTVRLAGGRAAAFSEGTLALAWATPAERPVREARGRFERIASLIAAAIRRLGVDARVGEVPGEYCPGAWSINARAQTKLAGIGQRLIAGAAHAGGVIVVDGAAAIRAALEPVYAALELEWDPQTVGSIADEIGACTVAEAEAAIVAELGERFELVESQLEPATLARAAELERSHEPEPGRDV